MTGCRACEDCRLEDSPVSREPECICLRPTKCIIIYTDIVSRCVHKVDIHSQHANIYTHIIQGSAVTIFICSHSLKDIKRQTKEEEKEVFLKYEEHRNLSVYMILWYHASRHCSK